ncbi:MAG TPA: hypothetical protein VI953_03815 [Candidatus Paceibacterota bacterium]
MPQDDEPRGGVDEFGDLKDILEGEVNDQLSALVGVPTITDGVNETLCSLSVEDVVAAGGVKQFLESQIATYKRETASMRTETREAIEKARVVPLQAALDFVIANS